MQLTDKGLASLCIQERWGAGSMLQVPMGILESINLEVIDLGESPVRLGGMKVGLPAILLAQPRV